MISLRRALRLGDTPQVAFVGAGGKTSALFALARQFDRPVLVTTSTHFAVDQLRLADQHLTIRTASELNQIDFPTLPPVTVLTGREIADDRVSGLDPAILQRIGEVARQDSLPLLIEADGARRLPLKGPGEHEPAIPTFADTVVVVAGLSALGRPLNEEWVHRPEQFSRLAEIQDGGVITADGLAKVLLSGQGGLKNIPTNSRRVALLNQADTPDLEGVAKKLAIRLLDKYDSVLVSSLQNSSAVKAVHESVAGIILAAGDSKRLGRPKQLLEWKGKLFVRQVAETALAAGLRPVIVVTGAEAQAVVSAFDKLPVQIVHNQTWASGQSSSVKSGLAALPNNTGAALFLVVDQPQLPVALIDMLRAEHAASLAPIVAPLVDGQRSNPVLFDRDTFPDFAALEGDVGGRAIFSRYNVIWLPWLDASLAIDVDEPEDYDRLLRQAG